MARSGSTRANSTTTRLNSAEERLKEAGLARTGDPVLILSGQTDVAAAEVEADEPTPTPEPAAGQARAHEVLPGEPPSPIDPPTGCPFHPRCPKVMDECRQRTPELIAVSDGNGKTRHVACHLYG